MHARALRLSLTVHPLFPRPSLAVRSSPFSFFHSRFCFSSSFARHVYFLLSLEPQLRPETRKSSKGDRWAPTEPSAEGGRDGRGRQTAPPASSLSLPVSEIKRCGRNLAEGCKYYKVTLRRMRELKGSPHWWEGSGPRRTMRASELTLGPLPPWT